MLATKSVAEVYSLWLNVPADALRNSESLFKRIIRERTAFVDNGVFKIDQLASMIDEALDYDKLRSQEVYVTLSQGGYLDEGLFGLLKSSYQHYLKRDSQAVYMPVSGQPDAVLKQMLLASCSIPVVFPAVSLANREYYDGGVYDNVPVKPLVEAGCDLIFVIHLHLLNIIRKDNYPGVRFVEIKHRRSLGALLNFDPERSRKLFELGYRDAAAVIAEIPSPIW